MLSLPNSVATPFQLGSGAVAATPQASIFIGIGRLKFFETVRLSDFVSS
jgi:hypothetical protein